MNAGDELIIEAQDLGELPLKFWGVDEYEYLVTVQAKDKDRVLLALLKKLYLGNPNELEDFQRYLHACRIPCEFFSHP